MTFPQLFRRLALACFCLFSIILFGQGVSYTGTPIALTRGGFPAAGATVTVCSGNVTVILTASPPCSPYASIYSDAGLTQPITQPGFKTDGLGNYPFFANGGLTYTIVLTGSGFTGASAVWNAPISGSANNTFTGSNTFNGQLLSQALNNIKYCTASTAGADGAARVNTIDAAATSLQAIFVDKACWPSTAATALSISNSYIIWTQPGTYLSSACTNTFNTKTGMGSLFLQSTGIATNQPPVVFGEAGGANCAKFIDVIGPFVTFWDFILDGSTAALNPTALDGIVIESNGQQGAMAFVTAQRFTRHGINFSGVTGAGPSTTCCWTLTSVASMSNGGDGLKCQGSNDISFMNFSQAQNNGGDGIEISDCPGFYLGGSRAEISGNNTSSGNAAIEIYGTTTGLGSNNLIIENCTMGNNVKDYIRITGYNGGSTSVGNIIQGCRFVAGVTPGLGANNTYDIVHLIDGGNNVISNNVMVTAGSPQAFKAAIEQTETASNRAVQNTVGLNQPIGAFGTATYIDSTTNGVIGAQFPIRGGGASSIDLFDITSSDTKPHKYLRVNGTNGDLQCLNNAFNAVLCDLSDTGVWETLGSIVPISAGGAQVGSSGQPWSSVFVGAAATNNIQVTGTATAARTATLPDGNSATVMTTNFTTTAATSDAVTLQGVTSSSHCGITATNSGGAGGIASVWYSVAANTVTVNHTATSGWTFTVMCTPN